VKIHRCPKDEAQSLILDRFFSPAEEGLTVVEFGRMRGPSDQSRLGDGWSTKRFAEHFKVGHLLSVDSDPGTLGVCVSMIEPAAQKKILYQARFDPLFAFDHYDLAYVDGPDDADVNARFLMDVWYGLGERSLVCVDDWSFRSKPRLIDDLLRRDHDAVVVGDTAVYWRKSAPRDVSWIREEA
jgi:hypothetical protein